jgi:hypothetical protein
MPGSLTRIEEVEPGDTCEAGGAVIHTGTDDNRDGALQTDEVDSSINVCSGPSGPQGDDGGDGTNGTNGQNGVNGTPGEDGSSVLSLVSDADEGLCPAGGSVVSFGADDDGNATLEASEVDSSTTVCNGERGEDACAPVVRITPIDPGAVCVAGGVLIAIGADSGALGSGGASGVAGGPATTSCDGVLSDDEVTGTRTLCNGVDGEDGEDGMDGDDGEDGIDGQDGAPAIPSLVTVSSEPRGVSCAQGGTRIDAGLDDGTPSGTANNGMLEPGEITSTSYACNGGSYTDWLVGTECGAAFSSTCTAAETGYHYKGMYDGYQCWWHTKNQAWNTTTSTNIYALAQQFGLDVSTAVQNWCVPFSGTPTPTSYGSFSSYTSPTNVGAWGWCGGAPMASGGWVCMR